MHEATIANSVVRTVLEHAENENAIQVKSVEIEVGELTFLNVEQMSFWIQIGFEGTIAQGAQIHIQKEKGQIYCTQCQYKGELHVADDPAFHMKLPLFSCPKCQSSQIEITQGKETVIRRIRIMKL